MKNVLYTAPFSKSSYINGALKKVICNYEINILLALE